MKVTIAEKFLLMSHRANDGKPLCRVAEIDLAVAGALLAEIALSGHLRIEDGDLAAQRGWLGDGVLDEVLRRVDQERPRSAGWWVRAIASKALRKRLFERLVGNEAVREVHSRFLGIFPSTRYLQREPALAHDAIERARGVVGGLRHDPEATVLLALAHECRLEKKIMPDVHRRDAKRAAAAESLDETTRAVLLAARKRIAADRAAAHSTG